MTSVLFTPFTLGGITVPNRIVVAPMCQYSAEEGVPTDWHVIHLGTMAMGGAGMVMIEATGVTAQARITHGDTGLYNDAQEHGFAQVLTTLRRRGTTPFIGMQLAHAGRKASTAVPWLGGKPLAPADGAWTTVAPSALPFAPSWHTPEPLDAAGMAQVRDAFVASAGRALRLGLDAIELHAAHGYLLHEFLSPLSNHRDDAYGGTRERRQRFPLEVAEALRAVWPRDRVLGIRVSATDWMEEGLTVDDTISFVQAVKAIGFDYVCVSSGGNDPRARIPVGPLYQVALAEQVKRATGLATRAVGLIVTPREAEGIIADGKADLVALARTVLDDPRWGWHAAEALRATVPVPPQYARTVGEAWPGSKQRMVGVAGLEPATRPL